jgi:hypothetical protein
MKNDIEKLSWDWVNTNPETAQIESEFYCKTRDVFQARLDKMIRNLIKESKVKEEDIYIVSAMAGEIGNNSFDHNLGKWPDISGIFFSYNFLDNKLKIALADRGQGILSTLKKIKPELANDSEALKTAFTERISGRAPEKRGNGLKFVKENIEAKKMHLSFLSGNAQMELNERMEIKETEKPISGCLAILTL